MIEFNGGRDERSAAPELREQVSAARDRISELVLVVVGISGALGLVTNLLATLVHGGSLAQTEWLALIAALVFAGAVALLAIARLRLTTRELDEEIELALPLLIPTANTPGSPIEVIEVSGYSTITELGHAAVAKLSPEQNAALAQAARRIDRGPSTTTMPLTLVPVPTDSEEEADEAESSVVVSSNDPVLWFLELAQLIVVAECLDESERLLGSEALFHRGRWLRRRTLRVRDVTWKELVTAAGAVQDFLGLPEVPGLRQRTTIPQQARIALTNVAEELARAKGATSQRRKSEGLRSDEGLIIPLVRIDAGSAGALTINGIRRVSAHGLPRLSQPQAGLTTRVFLAGREWGATTRTAPPHPGGDGGACRWPGGCGGRARTGLARAVSRRTPAARGARVSDGAGALSCAPFRSWQPQRQYPLCLVHGVGTARRHARHRRLLRELSHPPAGRPPASLLILGGACALPPQCSRRPSSEELLRAAVSVGARKLAGARPTRGGRSHFPTHRAVFSGHVHGLRRLGEVVELPHSALLYKLEVDLGRDRDRSRRVELREGPHI